MTKIVDINKNIMKLAEIHEQHRYFNAHHPKLRHLIIDLETVPFKGGWRAMEVAVYDHQKKHTIQHFYIDYGDGLSNRQDSTPYKEVLRILKILLNNTIAVCWNANSDIEALPQIELYSAGVHCAMTRYCRVMNTSFNLMHKDRSFLKLQVAANQIGVHFNWHICIEDTMAASKLWEFCDDNNLPRDYEISKEIEREFKNPKESPLLLEFSEDEISANYQASQNLAYLRSAFRKPKPYYRSLVRSAQTACKNAFQEA